jgi:hypothetical protein
VPLITFLPAPTPPPTYATIITITTTADPVDDTPSDTCYGTYPAGYAPPGDGVGCTLRRAIQEAGVLEVARPVHIKFNIPVTDTGYNASLNIWKIMLNDDLPHVKRGRVVIDGETQGEIGGRTTGPKIVINGGSIRLGEIAGHDNNVARGLAVQDGEIAAVLDHNIIENCWVGLRDDGLSIYYINDNPDQANYASIRAGGDHNLMQNNVSASAQGVSFNIAGDDNIAIDNYIGTRADGTIADVSPNRQCHADALLYNWFTGDGMHIGGARNRVENNVLAGMLFASSDPETTPPDAMEVTGHHNLIKGNRIGVDAKGKEVGVCGIGIYVNNGYNQFIDNEIAQTGSYAIAIFGSGISLDATTLKGNRLKDVPTAIEFGPLVPVARTYFNAAQITDVRGLDVSGTSGPDWSAGYDGPTGPSTCPFCRVELFTDDGDDQIEALEPGAEHDAQLWRHSQFRDQHHHALLGLVSQRRSPSRPHAGTNAPAAGASA